MESPFNELSKAPQWIPIHQQLHVNKRLKKLKNKPEDKLKNHLILLLLPIQPELSIVTVSMSLMWYGPSLPPNRVVQE